MLKKKITFLFVAIIGILTIALQSCNDNGSGGNTPEPTNPLAGTKWKLIVFGFGPSIVFDLPGTVLDYSNDNIIYDFQTNNYFIVSGLSSATYDLSLAPDDVIKKDGEYFYEYSKTHNCIFEHMDNCTPDGVLCCVAPNPPNMRIGKSSRQLFCYSPGNFCSNILNDTLYISCGDCSGSTGNVVDTSHICYGYTFIKIKDGGN